MSLPSPPSLVLRTEKGSALTHVEADANLTALKSYATMLSDLIGSLFSSDGTLNADAVATLSIVDRAITKAKLDSTAMPVYDDESAIANKFEINPSPALTAYEDGQLFFIQSANVTTGPCTVKVNALAEKDLVKLGGDAIGTQDLNADQVFCCVYKTDKFYIVSNVNRNFVMPAGSLVQEVSTETTEVLTTTATFDWDNTIPPDDEGSAYSFLDTAITPKNAANILEIDVIIPIGMGGADGAAIAALFWDGASPTVALAVGTVTVINSGVGQLLLKHRMTAGTVSTINFSIRIGIPSTGANTVNVNQDSSGPKYGGTMKSRFTIREYAA